MVELFCGKTPSATRFTSIDKDPCDEGKPAKLGCHMKRFGPGGLVDIPVVYITYCSHKCAMKVWYSGDVQ